MKRQVQETGVRKYFGGDLVELQRESLKALDAFFAEHGPCIIQGCGVTENAGGTYDVGTGMVALETEDTMGIRRVMVMPFDGVTGVALPVYLLPQRHTLTREYGDGKSKPIAYDYKAVASGVAPAAGVSHLKLTALGGVRFTDALQDASHRFITDAERAAWNAKETTGGSQVKADKALMDAKAYADTLKASADAALSDHDADAVKHLTATERFTWNAKETPAGSHTKALAAEEAAVRDSVLKRQIAGAQMGKGMFKSSDSRLLPTGDWSIAILFTTGANVTAEQGLFLNHTLAKNTQIIISGGYICLQWVGSGFARASVKPNSLNLVVFTYNKESNTPTLYVNNTKCPNYGSSIVPQDPNAFRLGSGYSSDFIGVIHDCRMFDFALSETQAASVWNGGHPELWCVPDTLRNIKPSAWPTDVFTPSLRTWVQNGTVTARTDNVASANGFSGSFQRLTNQQPGALSVYNAWRANNAQTDQKCYQLVEFEYRCDADLRVIQGSAPYLTFPANTGEAVRVSYVANAGENSNLSLLGTAGTFLEVRTLRIVTVGCSLDLAPAGLFDSEWKDLSGQSIDIPYVPIGINSEHLDFSYQMEGYPPTGQDNREELLAYANHYTAAREELLLKEAAITAMREDSELRLYVDEVGNTALDAATAYAEEQLALKQDKIVNIIISNFDTFNPSNVTDTKNLADGEFACFTSYDAIGRPDTTNSTGARMWSGRITRLRSGYYHLEATSGTSSSRTPNQYTRLYISGVAQEWMPNSESLNYGTDGYVMLPSGLMIQWGRYSPATGSSSLPINITFPRPFASTPLSIAFTCIDASNTMQVWSFIIKTYSTTKVAVLPSRVESSGTVGAAACQFFWQAIGVWR